MFFFEIFVKSFFTFSRYEQEEMLGDRRENGVEHNFNYCCPKRSVYEKFKNESNILTADGNITDAYRLEFEKCHNSFFVNYGQSVTETAIDSAVVPWYERPSFWIFACLVAICTLITYAIQELFFIFFYFLKLRATKRAKSENLIQKYCRRHVQTNRQHYLERTRREPLEIPEYDTTTEFLLGEGGGGRVYECRDESGIERAIKIVDTYKDNKFAKSLRKECLIQHAFNHTYILRIMSPNIDNIPGLTNNDDMRIERIVVEKYGWQMGKRNLNDLIHEIYLKG